MNNLSFVTSSTLPFISVGVAVLAFLNDQIYIGIGLLILSSLYEIKHLLKYGTPIYEEEEWEDWDNDIDNKSKKWEDDEDWDDMDYIPHDVWSGQWDYLWEKDIG